jgi:glutamate dehydrogenase (NAD(P)+)
MLGGSEGRSEATGRGTVYAIQDAAPELGMNLHESDVVVQGFGNAGSVAARLLWELGSKVVGVSDSSGGIYNSHGLNIGAVEEYKRRNGSVVGFPECDLVTNQELLELPCDILVPAALEEQITEHNASRVKAKLIAEAANGPTTPEADRILYDKGVFTLPDIYANAGGVTVSYFEWVQALQAFPWTEAEVNERLKAIMSRAFKTVYSVRQQRNVHMRTAALAVAIQRVADFTRIRGIYP